MPLLAVATRCASWVLYSLRMKPSPALADLAKYVAVLSNSLASTHRAEDRSRYRDHLAASAGIFESLYRGDIVSTKQFIADERRSFGWDFLTGEEGAAAESAFSRFADMIENL